MEAGHYLEGEVKLDAATIERITAAALQVTRVYGYDINMSEFVMDGDEMYLINATNPSPLMGRDLMTEEQFKWACEAVAELAIRRTTEPRPQGFPINLSGE
jgi:hypothetical protein